MSTSRPDSLADPFLTAPNTPLNLGQSLEPPRASYLSSTPETATSPRDSYADTPDNVSPLVPENEKRDAIAYGQESRAEPGLKKRSILRRPLFWLIAFAVITVVVLAIVLPVYFVVIKPHNYSTNGASAGGAPAGGAPAGGSGSGSGNPTSPPGVTTTGGNGSIIKMADGTTFTYLNPFGGIFENCGSAAWPHHLLVYYFLAIRSYQFFAGVENPNDPFNNGAYPNSWTPPLNSSWTWGVNKIYGVNIGGLFVLEPFITPALYQKYPGAVDEWTLSTLMAADTASGGLQQLETHYSTFITEQDIAEIAGAGLNWIRLPIPFWAVEKWDFEPFLEKVCWPYILRVLQWARKYGIRVNLDLHTIPGSQNGYNHSGKLGSINFLNGVMGLANAQRALDYIRIITEFISQPEWVNVVPVFSIVNEALVSTIGTDQITAFYLLAHDMIRNITGTAAWANFLQGSDRIILDTHPYFAFDGQSIGPPIATGTGLSAGGIWPQQACSAWGPGINTSQTAFGITIAGEFSDGYNDCGLYLTGVGNTASYGTSCSLFLDSSQWNDTMKAGLYEFTLASMDALQNWFFWTWKVGNSSTTNSVQSPLWSYQLGLQHGWIPTDPRTAMGTCAALGEIGPQFDGVYQAYQTGGPGAGTIVAASVTSYGQYPPTPINGLPLGAIQSLLPTYTSTSAVPTLPPPTFSPSPSPSVNAGNGWFDSGDTGLAPTQVQGCTYPNAWDAVSSPMPTALCPSTGGVTPVTTPPSSTR
ncbi:glycoside hydrolase family 5 protein [Suillus placidus]|uniref:glucan 1,3-beta-glucosidase n=1 Tax=Suillus placidus TaxID=48579 RepID=A0A9P6ZIU2_9AGAM|nr:glycoside hydrolase family 5 protein [Suillus placidus]